MEHTIRHGAREQGRDAAAARLVRAAVLRLALALGISAFTAALSLAALSARTGQLVATPAPAAVPAQRVATGGADHHAAAPALRTDI